MPWNLRNGGVSDTTITRKAGKKYRKMDWLFAVEIAKGPLYNTRQLEKSGEVSYKEIELIWSTVRTANSWTKTINPTLRPQSSRGSFTPPTRLLVDRWRFAQLSTLNSATRLTLRASIPLSRSEQQFFGGPKKFRHNILRYIKAKEIWLQSEEAALFQRPYRRSIQVLYILQEQKDCWVLCAVLYHSPIHHANCVTEFT